MKSPESRQFRPEHPHLSARNVLTAGIAAIAMGAASPESVHASEHQRGPIESGLIKFNALSQGDPTCYMGGKYESIVVDEGTSVYRFSKDNKKIIRTELPDDTQVVHPVVSQKNGNNSLFFHSGSTSYGLRINKNSSAHVKKVAHDGQRSALRASDIQPVQTHISHVENKDYLFARGVKGNEYSSPVRFDDGSKRFVMAIGLGITESSEPRQSKGIDKIDNN